MTDEKDKLLDEAAKLLWQAAELTGNEPFTGDDPAKCGDNEFSNACFMLATKIMTRLSSNKLNLVRAS